MDKVKFLLKFGQREHMESFADGYLYCSNAKTFWGIEDTLKIKGQGDRLEASSRFFAQNISVYDVEDGHFVGSFPASSGLVRYEPAEQIPVFCLFSVYEKDCSIDQDGSFKIHLSEKTKQTIINHFPNADTVVIIDNPAQFLMDVENSIGCEIKHGCVQYFNIDKGYQRGDGVNAMDMDYMKYLMQDTPPVVEGNKRTYRFLEKYVYRCLFCKDIYFKDEQEYRIVLQNEKIESGKVYPVKYDIKLNVMNLEDFLKQ